MIARKLMKKIRISNGNFSSMVSSVMSICRIKPLASAFSLMEMMVVMLVVAVIMALAAPMITKKSGGAGAGTGCLWTSLTGGHIGYNTPTGTAETGRSVVIGTSQNNISKIAQYAGTLLGSSGAQYSPRLIIGTPSQGTAGSAIPAIGFLQNDTATGLMHIGTGNKMFIGHNAVVKGTGSGSDINSIAIGYETKVEGNNIIAIGTDIVTANSDTVAIGSNMKDSTAPAGQSVAIGINASTGGNGAVAIGYNTSAKNNGIAIGKGDSTVLSTDGGVIIGSDGAVAGTNSVAIGRRTKANGQQSTAVGVSAEAYNKGVAVGFNAKAESGVAIGSNGTEATTGVAVGNGATATSGVAIGTGTHSTANCDAIGTGASCSANGTIVIGDSSKTVIINAQKIQFTTSNGMVFNNTSGEVNISSDAITLNSNQITATGDIAAYYIETEAGADFGGNTYVDQLIANGDVGDAYGNSLRSIIWTAESAKDTAEAAWAIAQRFSDKRLKDIIGENLDAMDKINQLKVYNFTFKDDEDKTPRVGVMAQDLQKVFPNAVVKGEDGYLRIRHEDMFYSMINALKELDAKIKAIATQIAENIKVVAEQKAEIKALKAKVDKQDKEIEELRAEIKDLKKIVDKLAK